MRKPSSTRIAILTVLALAVSPVSAQTDTPTQIDYITAAHGAWLVSIDFAGAEIGPKRSQAFETFDGLSTPRTLLGKAERGARLELVFELPAATTFERLAVPEVAEVPNSYTTFFREVEVLGSVEGAEGQVTIVGHTSSEGSDEYNQGLSERRAQSVVDDLVRRGIDAGRIAAQGSGEQEPIASNRDEIGRSLNRRVEVRCTDG